MYLPRLALLTVTLLSLSSPVLGQSVVISQVYGGGGNQGATLQNDFVELLNVSGATVSLDGWTIQYASASGSSWSRANLSGSLAPGQYYLIQGGMGQSGNVCQS